MSDAMTNPQAHLEEKQRNEMRSLIDGAYDIVYMFKPSSPSQIEWKKNWLERARYYGASLN